MNHMATQSFKSVPFIPTIGVIIASFLCIFAVGVLFTGSLVDSFFGNIGVTINTLDNADKLALLFNHNLDTNIINNILKAVVILTYAWYVLQFIIGLKLFMNMKIARYVGISIMLLSLVMFVSDIYLVNWVVTGESSIVLDGSFYELNWITVGINSTVMVGFFLVLYFFFAGLSKKERAFSSRYPR